MDGELRRTLDDAKVAAGTRKLHTRAMSTSKSTPMSEPKPISVRGMSNSLTRMLDLLPLFSTTQPVLTLEEIVEKTGYARSTAYRYVKVLTSSGLLSPVAGRAYGLGPFIVELDRTIRITDPLLQVAPAVMSTLNQTTGQAVILGRYFRRSVICVHQEGEAQGFTPTFGRGREMPKFASATSRAILANLPAREIKEVYLADARQIAEAGLGADWAAFRGLLREFRARGYAVSSPGAVDADASGIAAPVFDSRGMCLAAVTVVSSLKRAVIKFDELVKLTVAAAQDISTLLKDREQRLSDAEAATHAAASAQPRRRRKAARATGGRGRFRAAAI